MEPESIKSWQAVLIQAQLHEQQLQQQLCLLVESLNREQQQLQTLQDYQQECRQLLPGQQRGEFSGAARQQQLNLLLELEKWIQIQSDKIMQLDGLHKQVQQKTLMAEKYCQNIKSKIDQQKQSLKNQRQHHFEQIALQEMMSRPRRNTIQEN